MLTGIADSTDLANSLFCGALKNYKYFFLLCLKINLSQFYSLKPLTNIICLTLTSPQPLVSEVVTEAGFLQRVIFFKEGNKSVVFVSVLTLRWIRWKQMHDIK